MGMTIEFGTFKTVKSKINTKDGVKEFETKEFDTLFELGKSDFIFTESLYKYADFDTFYEFPNQLIYELFDFITTGNKSNYVNKIYNEFEKNSNVDRLINKLKDYMLDKIANEYLNFSKHTLSDNGVFDKLTEQGMKFNSYVELVDYLIKNHKEVFDKHKLYYRLL